MVRRLTGTTVSDEWFAHFITELENNKPRVRRLLSERWRPLPPAEMRSRVYDAETERLRGTLHAAA